MVFYKNFKAALKILKDRLAKKDKEISVKDYSFSETQDLKYLKRELNFSLFNEESISTEIDKKIDKERISDEIYIEDEKTRSD